MLQLILPDKRYQLSFCVAAADRAKLSQNLEWLQFEIEHFDDYLEYVQKLRVGQGAKGSAAQTQYWLVDDDKYIGEIHIRHQPSGNPPSHIYYDIAPQERQKGYGNLILKLGLEKAKELGIATVIVTCNQNNSASKKIIEVNGGILQTRHITENGVLLLYTIKN